MVHYLLIAIFYFLLIKYVVFGSIIQLKSLNEKAAIKSGDKIKSKKYEQQKQLVVEYLRANTVAKREHIADILNLKDTRTKDILSRMIDEEIIVTEGGKRNRTYRLK